MNSIIRIFPVVVLLGVIISGCTLSIGNDSAADMGEPVVYIHPTSKLYGNSTAGVLPFHVPANVSHEQGFAVAALFKDVFLAKRAFPVVKQMNTPYGDFEEAIHIGKDAGVDLVLAGSINYYIEGAGLGGSKVDASIRLLNVRTGNTIWYMEQSMNQKVDYPDTGLINRAFTSFLHLPVEKRPEVEESTTTKMLVRIASSMTDVLKSRL